jgi:hypothetical protein
VSAVSANAIAAENTATSATSKRLVLQRTNAFLKPKRPVVARLPVALLMEVRAVLAAQVGDATQDFNAFNLAVGWPFA